VPFDQCWDAGPIRFGLQLPAAIRGPRVEVIGESNIVADEDFIFQSHPFANKSVTRNFATIPDFDAFLDFDKCADFYVVSNFTTIQIDKPMESNVSTQLDIRSNPLERLLRKTHRVEFEEARRPRTRSFNRSFLPSGREVFFFPMSKVDMRMADSGIDGVQPLPVSRPERLTEAPPLFSDWEDASKMRTNSSPCLPSVKGVVP